MDLTEVEVIDLKTELQVFDPIAVQIAEMKKKNANLAFDYDSKDGNKGARSWIASLRKLKKPITETHKLAKAEAKKFCDALDGKKKELLGVVEEMIKVHHEPIWEIEQREAAIEAEKQLEAQRLKDEEEAKKQADLEAREKAVADERAKLEVERREIEQRAREARAALDAKKEVEYQAKRDLEAADNKRIAEVQATKDKAAAEATEKDRQLAEEKEKDRMYQLELESQEQERQANVEHRRKIHTDIYEFLVNCPPLDQEIAKRIFMALKNNEIPHVTINY